MDYAAPTPIWGCLTLQLQGAENSSAALTAFLCFLWHSIIHGDDPLRHGLQCFVTQALKHPINIIALGHFGHIVILVYCCSVWPITTEECKRKEKGLMLIPPHIREHEPSIGFPSGCEFISEMVKCDLRYYSKQVRFCWRKFRGLTAFAVKTSVVSSSCNTTVLIQLRI